jgi:hypothetical protein
MHPTFLRIWEAEGIDPARLRAVIDELGRQRRTFREFCCSAAGRAMLKSAGTQLLFLSALQKAGGHIRNALAEVGLTMGVLGKRGRVEIAHLLSPDNKHDFDLFALRLRNDARAALLFAAQFAAAAKSENTGTEHLLAALLTMPSVDDRNQGAKNILTRVGVEEKLRVALGLTGLCVSPGMTDVRPSENLKLLIDRAQSEAGAARAGTEHMLVAMSALGQGAGNRLLLEAGVVEGEIRRLMPGSQDDVGK